MENDVTAVIPAHNEEKTIADTIKTIKQIEEVTEIIVINDGSTDKTQQILRNYPITVLDFPKNRGKGFALFSATKFCINNYIVFVDADLGSTAKEILKLIYPILNREADITVAKFKCNKGEGFGLVKSLAKWSSHLLTGKSIDSILSGQRAMAKDHAEQLLEKEHHSRYGVEWGMTVEALIRNYDILEIEVSMEHNWTKQNLSGNLHRSKQFWQIAVNFMRKLATIIKQTVKS